jgi:hypothetical protein
LIPALKKSQQPTQGINLQLKEKKLRALNPKNLTMQWQPFFCAEFFTEEKKEKRNWSHIPLVGGWGEGIANFWKKIAIFLAIIRFGFWFAAFLKSIVYYFLTIHPVELTCECLFVYYFLTIHPVELTCECLFVYYFLTIHSSRIDL